jgi:hypothetical protein
MHQCFFNPEFVYGTDVKKRVGQILKAAYEDRIGVFYDAVIVIKRGSRHDYYPFDTRRSGAFKRVSVIGTNDGVQVERDTHTEGYPVYEVRDNTFDDWARSLVECGIVDAAVLIDYNDALPPGHYGKMRGCDSRYHIYARGRGGVLTPIEDICGYDEDPLHYLIHAVYEFEPNHFIDVNRISTYLSRYRKAFRRSASTFMRHHSQRSYDPR